MLMYLYNQLNPDLPDLPAINVRSVEEGDISGVELSIRLSCSSGHQPHLADQAGPHHGGLQGHSHGGGGHLAQQAEHS